MLVTCLSRCCATGTHPPAPQLPQQLLGSLPLPARCPSCSWRSTSMAKATELLLSADALPWNSPGRPPPWPPTALATAGPASATSSAEELGRSNFLACHQVRTLRACDSAAQLIHQALPCMQEGVFTVSHACYSPQGLCTAALSLATDPEHQSTDSNAGQGVPHLAALLR